MTTYRYSVKTENPLTQKTGTRTVVAEEIDSGDDYFVDFHDSDGVVAMIRKTEVVSITRKSEAAAADSGDDSDDA